MRNRSANPEHVISRSRIQGFWRTRVQTLDGVMHNDVWRKNLIVNKVSELFAYLLKSAGSVSGPFGIQYYALGAGLAGWDTTLPPPQATDTTLETELVDGLGAAASRKVPTITYLDSSGVPTGTNTSRLRLTMVYDYSELNSASAPALNKWREFGVYCGNASATGADTGYLLNHVTHGLFTKTALLRVTREVEFVL